MRYKTDEWRSHLLANFIAPSPSLAEGFVQVCLDGVEEVCGVDVVLVQLDTEDKKQKWNSARRRGKQQVSNLLFLFFFTGNQYSVAVLY